MAGLNRITQSRPAPPAVVPCRTPPLSLDLLLAYAEAELPGGIVTYLILPENPEGALTVRKELDVEMHPNGRNYVIGKWGGTVTRVLYVLLGLSPLGLFVSGG